MREAAAAVAAVIGVVLHFGRPHTLIGTTLAVAAHGAIAFAALHTAAQPSPALPSACPVVATLALMLVAALAANVYVVGLNQITDVSIDRVNKPGLPLPAGRLSRRSAGRIAFASGAIALSLSAWLGPWMLSTVVAAMGVGTAYSLPPLRFKRRALPAALAIALVRGPVVNLGLHAHLREAWGLPPGWAALSLVLAAFFFVYTLGIAVAKDVDDVEGDRAYDVQTVAVTRGRSSALRRATALLAIAYLVAILLALWLVDPRLGLPLAWSHGVLLALLLARSAALEGHPDTPVAPWYRDLWRLFYVEYALVGFVALWPMLEGVVRP